MMSRATGYTGTLPLVVRDVLHLSWSEGDARVAVAATSGLGSPDAIDVYDTATGRLVRAIRPTHQQVECIRLARDGRSLCVVSHAKQGEGIPPTELWQWAVDEPKEPRKLVAQVPAGIFHLAPSQDGRLVALCSTDPAASSPGHEAWSILVADVDHGTLVLDHRVRGEEGKDWPLGIGFARDGDALTVLFSTRLESWTLPGPQRTVVRALPSRAARLHADAGYVETLEPHAIVAITSGVARPVPSFTTRSVVMADGTWLAIDSVNLRSWGKGKVGCRVERFAPHAKKVTSSKLAETADTWWLSPSGKHVLFARISTSELGIVELATGNVQMLDRTSVVRP